MWSDTETRDDFLNYAEMAEVVALMLTDTKMLPLSVGVFGGWGTGKSSFLKMVEARIPRRTEEAGKGKEPRYIVIQYDAWLYQGYDDARAALMDSISARLLAEADSRGESVKKKAAGLFRRVDKLRLLALGADVAMIAAGLPPPTAITKGWGALSRIVAGQVGAAEAAEVMEGAKEVRERGTGLLRPEEKETPPQEIDEFRKEFASLLTDLDAVLIVFIDNLDRCLPDQLIHTLEALRLFLFMGNTAFCVAADEDMVQGAIKHHFAGFAVNHIRDYLDKLIQVPIRVPRLGVPEISSYLMLLFAEVDAEVPAERLDALQKGVSKALRDAWLNGPLDATAAAKLVSDPPPHKLVGLFELAERMAPLLANSSDIKGNPRIIKRLLNTMRIRLRLARVRDVEADETVIAKLALFERCMGEKAAVQLYMDIQNADDGRSPVLQALEQAASDDTTFKKALHTDWAGPEQERFVREWVTLKPPLGELDLRAVSYLSRDTVALAGRRRGLSPAAADALKALSTVTRLPSPAARTAALGIPASEREDVMDGLLTAMRRHRDWRTRPIELNGADEVAKLEPGLAETLKTFLTEIGGSKPPAWMSMLLKSPTSKASR